MPLNLFKERRLSMLETIVLFLKNKGLPNKDIAKFLNRDQKTVSCVLHRVKTKSSNKYPKTQKNMRNAKLKQIFGPHFRN